MLAADLSESQVPEPSVELIIPCFIFKELHPW